MGFGFGGLQLPPQQDPSGIDVGAALARLTGGAPQAYAPMPQAQPAPADSVPQPTAPPQTVGLPDVPVSGLEATLSWLAHGGTPAEAAMRAREVKVQNLTNAMALKRAQDTFQLMGGLGDRDRLDAYLNGPEFAKADAANIMPQKAGPDETVLFRGGAVSPGGSEYHGGGTYTAANGVVTNSQHGVVGNYATPQTVAGRLYPFQAGYSGSAGAPGPALGWILNGQRGPAPGGLQSSVSTPIGGGAAPPSAPPASTVPPTSNFDALNFIKTFVLPHEGGLNPRDMNGAPSKFGINAKANPGVDVPNLTADQAADIYMHKYLPLSGAQNLPPALAAVHLDTSIINPSRAQEFLQRSNGDPAAYLALRQGWMEHMLQTNPAAKPYAHAWASRNADLGKLIAGQGASPAQGMDQGGQQSAQMAQNGDVSTRIGPAAGRTGNTLTPEERQAEGISPNDSRSFIWSPEGMPKPIDPEYSPGDKATLRNHVLTSDEYKQANAAQAAYKAMIANAATMTGPGAYSMLDTFARAINPGAVARPTVIETLEHSLGPLNGVKGAWDRVLGQGNLTPEVRQQIIDAVVPFAQAHWDQAKMLNESNAEIAKSHGFKAEDVTAPMEDRAQRMIVTPDGAITEAQALAQARQAIKAGAPRDKVIGRLQSMRIKPAGL